MGARRLYGSELLVHGWHHFQGEIHLLLTLPAANPLSFRDHNDPTWMSVSKQLT